MNPDERMRGYLAKVATGPHLSKDLPRDEARDAMAMILAGEVDPVQAAVFLVALRMKRETVDEYAGALDALRGAASVASADVDTLVDIGEPYDGYVRHLPASPFLPATLAACGLPAVIHGCEELPPKRGVTVHRVLQAAGVGVDDEPAAAARAVADRGWAYVGVERYCPPLAGLVKLRDLIVKRPLLNTVEKLIGPVRGRRNCLVVGYVHRGYDELLIALARKAGYDAALVVKGIEGGTIPSLTATSTASGYTDAGEAGQIPLAAAEVGIAADERAAPIPEGVRGLDAISRAAAEAGLAALDGATGPTRDALVHAGSAILVHAGAAASRPEAAERVRAALDRGEALQRLR